MSKSKNSKKKASEKEKVNVNEAESKACISSQNRDTGLASYNADDTRPYEQKNTSAGFHVTGTGLR
jgi:hypothetical protein